VHDSHNIHFTCKAWKIAATDLNQVLPCPFFETVYPCHVPRWDGWGGGFLTAVLVCNLMLDPLNIVRSLHVCTISSCNVVRGLHVCTISSCMAHVVAGLALLSSMFRT